MKYCGLVTDRSWIESEVIHNQPELASATCIPGFGIKENEITSRRIYSDEVPMADKSLIKSIKFMAVTEETIRK